MSDRSDENTDKIEVRIPGGAALAQTLTLHPMQRMAADHLLKSQQINVPVTIIGEADADALVALRERQAAAPGDDTGQRISLTHMLIAITAAALRRHAKLNSVRSGRNLEIYAEINIGLALALPDGNLIVPVIKKADTLNLPEIASVVSDLRRRGETGKLGLDDVRGGTFTLTNAGMVASARWTTPIIPLGQTAILGVGGVRRAPVVKQEQVVPGWLLPLSLTFDHGAINGYPASEFLEDLATCIADPSTSGANFSTEPADAN